MGKVLICDDSAFTLQRHKKMFEALGHEVETVSSGKTAYDKLKAGEKFDLLVMDLLMPDQDGITALKNIKSLDPDQKVIIVSADIQQSRRDEVMANGGIDLVNKPLDEEKLKAVMAKVSI